MDSPLSVFLRQWIRPRVMAALQGLALAVLSLAVNVTLFVLSVTSLALIPALGIGLVLFPAVTVLVRLWTGLQRGLAGRGGVQILTPYRPLPQRARLGTWRRFRWVVGDPATWRDLAWLVPGAVSGTLCLLAFVVPGYGLEGILLVPFLLYFTVDWYGYGIYWPMENFSEAWYSIPQGWFFLIAGLALAPWLLRLHWRFAGLFLAPTRSEELALRVRHLTVTRTDTVDAQAAELRRIERDLHDGAQARLVALSMNIGLAEELVVRDPVAAQRLLVEAREASGQALVELRDLVRGIHPPVLAERGLEGAVRALALTVPLPVEVDVELPGRPLAPVESAAYFATAEALTNIAKHSGATRAWIRLRHEQAKLAITVADDGKGGADPKAGTGLAGMQRRLAAFDGTMTVASPAGGPTVVTMELPCELSSPRTSPSFGKG
ncbi:MAG TPA: sensor histidine kinase [Micromonosporaceae bacterium]|nr:sensor histidine kinase [Micromonosporaceae bacterium]